MRCASGVNTSGSFRGKCVEHSNLTVRKHRLCRKCRDALSVISDPENICQIPSISINSLALTVCRSKKKQKISTNPKGSLFDAQLGQVTQFLRIPTESLGWRWCCWQSFHLPEGALRLAEHWDFYCSVTPVTLQR
jgi:hypothetical protein